MSEENSAPSTSASETSTAGETLPWIPPDGPIRVEVEDDIEPLVPRFIEHQWRDLAQMREAVADGDADRLRILGHSMKGSGGGYGFHFLTEIGGRVEDAARRRDLSRVSAMLDRIEDYLKRIEPVFVPAE